MSVTSGKLLASSREGSLLGRRCRPIKTIYNVPLIRMVSPTGVKSNIANGVNPDSDSDSLINILNGVPINVFKPPIREEKASGINNFDGWRLVRRAISIRTGKNRDATPILFMNPDRMPLVSMMIVSSFTSLSPANCRKNLPSLLAKPVLANPPLRIRTAQTVITAGLLNPDKASVGVINPLMERLARTSNPTRSILTLFVIKSRIAKARMERTRIMSGVIDNPISIKTGEKSDRTSSLL